MEFILSPEFPSVFYTNCLITLNIMSKLGDGWQEVAVERGGKLFGRQLRGTSHSKRCCNNYANFNLLRLAGTRTCRSSIATFGRPRKQERKRGVRTQDSSNLQTASLFEKRAKGPSRDSAPPLTLDSHATAPSQRIATAHTNVSAF